jgi:multisubunit Na+/H+ antiporter MnhF subunit
VQALYLPAFSLASLFFGPCLILVLMHYPYRDNTSNLSTLLEELILLFVCLLECAYFSNIALDYALETFILYVLSDNLISRSLSRGENDL